MLASLSASLLRERVCIEGFAEETRVGAVGALHLGAVSC